MNGFLVENIYLFYVQMFLKMISFMLPRRKSAVLLMFCIVKTRLVEVIVRYNYGKGFLSDLRNW